jgi:hypothetical protein
MYNLNYAPTIMGGHKLEEKINLGVRELQRLNITGLDD